MLAFALPALAAFTPYQQLKAARVQDVRSSALVSPLDGLAGGRSLVVVLPQLGEFDSAEMCEQLVAVADDLQEAGIALRVVGIGDQAAGQRFSAFTGLPLDALRLDSDGSLHRALELHEGPGWETPDLPDAALRFLLSTLPGGAPTEDAELRPAFKGWLNYLAMCAGLGAPGTLAEIARGYLGDTSAPERFAADAVVTAGPVEIGPGVGPVKVGPIRYSQWWADEAGYQRPIELATVRLRNMVEVLGKWDTYVTNRETIALRGATYLFDEAGELLYSYRHRGVLTYSETMPRPLSFLAPYIGEGRARNPLRLGDASGDGRSAAAAASGRGALKPAGKAMGLLAPFFRAQSALQARLLGVDEQAREEARAELTRATKAHPVLVYTYALSPFSSAAVALLEAEGVAHEVVPLGGEWFLLGKRGSAMRLELMERTGQSSLPHVFIGGKHVGGMFTSPPDAETGKGGGLAALRESGELGRLVAAAQASQA